MRKSPAQVDGPQLLLNFSIQFCAISYEMDILCNMIKASDIGGIIAEHRKLQDFYLQKRHRYVLFLSNQLQNALNTALGSRKTNEQWKKLAQKIANGTCGIIPNYLTKFSMANLQRVFIWTHDDMNNLLLFNISFDFAHSVTNCRNAGVDEVKLHYYIGAIMEPYDMFCMFLHNNSLIGDSMYTIRSCYEHSMLEFYGGSANNFKGCWNLQKLGDFNEFKKSLGKLNYYPTLGIYTLPFSEIAKESDIIEFFLLTDLMKEYISGNELAGGILKKYLSIQDEKNNLQDKLEINVNKRKGEQLDYHQEAAMSAQLQREKRKALRNELQEVFVQVENKRNKKSKKSSRVQEVNENDDVANINSNNVSDTNNLVNQGASTMDFTVDDVQAENDENEKNNLLSSVERLINVFQEGLDSNAVIKGRVFATIQYSVLNEFKKNGFSLIQSRRGSHLTTWLRNSETNYQSAGVVSVRPHNGKEMHGSDVINYLAMLLSGALGTYFSRPDQDSLSHNLD